MNQAERAKQRTADFEAKWRPELEKLYPGASISYEYNLDAPTLHRIVVTVRLPGGKLLRSSGRDFRDTTAKLKPDFKPNRRR